MNKKSRRSAVTKKPKTR